MSGSFLHDGRLVRSDEISKEERERIIAEDLARLAEMTDEDIDLSDIPEMTAEDWDRSVPNRFYRQVKEQVTLQLDQYVLDWFRENHEQDESAINAALIEHIRRARAAKADQCARKT